MTPDLLNSAIFPGGKITRTKLAISRLSVHGSFDTKARSIDPGTLASSQQAYLDNSPGRRLLVEAALLSHYHHQYQSCVFGILENSHRLFGMSSIDTPCQISDCIILDNNRASTVIN